MGLSAVVFKSPARLQEEYPREFEVVDVETGEADAVGSEDFLSLEQSSAAHARIGNPSDVSYIKDAVASALGEKSFIAEHVLYSGSHSGDCIRPDHVQSLRDELNGLKQIDDSEVARFVREMEALGEVTHRLPLVDSHATDHAVGCSNPIRRKILS